MSIDIIKTFIKKLATQGHSFSKEKFAPLLELLSYVPLGDETRMPERPDLVLELVDYDTVIACEVLDAELVVFHGVRERSVPARETMRRPRTPSPDAARHVNCRNRRFSKTRPRSFKAP